MRIQRTCIVILFSPPGWVAGRAARPRFRLGGAPDFFSSQTPSEHHHSPPTSRRRQWRSTLWQDRGVPVTKRALEPAQPHSCRHRRQPKSQTRGKTPDRVPAHQENEFCNNYSVISTHLCLFNHNRHPALSMTCNPTPRPKVCVYCLRTYISIRTITPAQSVRRGTLYVQSWPPYQRRDDEDMLSKGTGPVGGGPAPTSGLYFPMLLSCDKRFQSNAVRNHKRRAALLDEMLLLEAREKPADRLARRADHLPDLFVSQTQLHLAGVLGCGVLVEPSD